ncbi:hypothetical protein BT96DRAFT_956733 [Gymnopus androsaceus JB14]|uniref:Uncharacterized protein n=1 Tax=Gymnopus androsaceus JB14 TaxID=1447944 RepID=A0A6A4HTV4_9AGAR|nr:hypothetical protein BT96DRAFT_956733 [Gymnopus androsaceus JB14]
MSLYELSRQLRLIFTEAPDAISLAELLSIADSLVSDPSSVDSEELQTIHDDVVDHSLLYHAQVLLAVLYHLKAILTPLTIITFWFDIVLRPALREPKLATPSVTHAKELILAALHSDDGRFHEKIREFRTRLFDLYLLDAMNEGSEEDVLEWAELDNAQRDKKACWKSNLEDIMLRFGEIHPNDFMTDVHEHFNVPSSRLQLIMLMNLYTSSPVFEPLAAILAPHPLMSSLLSSLLYDNSSTSCTVSLTILVKLLPMLAVHACGELKSMIPQLFVIFIRMLCWKERVPLPHDESDEKETEADFTDAEAPKVPALHRENDWKRLELVFGRSPSAPSAVRIFTYLYYLFPCNLLRFLRGPTEYLTERGYDCPYVGGWGEALDASEIRTKSEHLIRGHICHPLIIWQDAQGELSNPDFWKNYDVARISSETMSLDIRYTSLALRERHPTEAKHPHQQNMEILNQEYHSKVWWQTSVLLKSTVDLKTEPITEPWPSTIFASDNLTTSRPSSESIDESVFEADNPQAPSSVTQAISGLQREILLLRNELNFELWLSRENYNKLRNYRTQVVRLEQELREHKELASSARQKHTDWSSELQTKLREFREEKKAWISEAASLRTTHKQVEATLLAEALDEVFKLQTFIKEHQHKIDRLHDYEAEIEQDADFDKFSRRGEDIDFMKSKWKQMEMRLESFEKTQLEMEEQARQHRRQIQSLESRRTQEHEDNQAAGRYPAMALATVTAEKGALVNTNKQLEEKNTELREEVEELEVMLEQLRAQVSGKQGLVYSEPRSPVVS